MYITRWADKAFQTGMQANEIFVRGGGWGGGDRLGMEEAWCLEKEIDRHKICLAIITKRKKNTKKKKRTKKKNKQTW